MCVALPVRIVELLPESMAKVALSEMNLDEINASDASNCNSEDSTIIVALHLLPEEPKLGDYVIVHAGFALQTLTKEQALENLQLIQNLIPVEMN